MSAGDATSDHATSVRRGTGPKPSADPNPTRTPPEAAALRLVRSIGTPSAETDRHPADPEPSELAVGFAELLRSLPMEAVADVERLLAWRLTYVEPAVLREARLGLLLDMVTDAEGSMPLADDYETERAARAAQGESWPAASTLSRVYNGWARACRAAIRLVEVGVSTAVGSAGAPSTRAPNGAPRRNVVFAALSQYRREYGRWPAQTEYHRWRRDLRRRASRLGLDDPELPSLPQIRASFGDFDRATGAARRSAW